MGSFSSRIPKDMPHCSWGRPSLGTGPARAARAVLSTSTEPGRRRQAGRCGRLSKSGSQKGAPDPNGRDGSCCLWLPRVHRQRSRCGAAPCLPGCRRSSGLWTRTCAPWVAIQLRRSFPICKVGLITTSVRACDKSWEWPRATQMGFQQQGAYVISSKARPEVGATPKDGFSSTACG